jgi:hypothetical protein
MGHWNLEPYLFYTVNTGRYNRHWKPHSIPHFHSATFQAQVKIGLLPWMDCQFFPQVSWNETQGKHGGGFGDIPIGMNFQLVSSAFHDPWPAVKLALRANIPTGKYQHLNPHRKKTDALGAGSWLPGIGLIASKILHISGIHDLDLRLAVMYFIGSGVHVKGYNSYGGSRSTRGTVYPGNQLSIDAAFQYSLTQRWALACDLIYNTSNKTRFSGKTAASMRAPSNAQWSIAPAIEYNWSDELGIIVGPWLSLAGRNAVQFWSGIVAFNAYF